MQDAWDAALSGRRPGGLPMWVPYAVGGGIAVVVLGLVIYKASR
jgi:hypothetical protein